MSAPLSLAGFALLLQGEAGYFLSGGVPRPTPQFGAVQRNRPYVSLRADATRTSGSGRGKREWGLSSHVRFWSDLQGESATPRLELQVQDLSLFWESEWVRVSAGCQVVTWTDSFGIFPADVVNPRDHRDPVFNDLGWIRQAVPLLRTEWTLGGGVELDAMVSPFGQHSVLPVGGTLFDPLSQTCSQCARTSPTRLPWEGGGRLRLDVGGGFVSSVLAYTHANRNLALVSSATLANTLEQAAERVTTYGLQLSQDMGEGVILRAESTYDSGAVFALQDASAIARTNSIKALIGADWTTQGLPGKASSRWRMGTQYLFESRPAALGSAELHTLLANVQQKLDRPALEIDLQFLAGLNHQDLWIRPMLSGPIGDSSRWSLRADFLVSQSSAGAVPGGYFAGLYDRNRILSWLSFRF